MLRRGFLRRSAVRCFKWDGGEKGNRMPDVVAAETGATPAAFYLGLCRLRGILSLIAPHDCAAGGPFFCAATMVLQAGCSSVRQRWCCRRAVLSCSSDDAASIRKSEPEIKNRCTLEGINRQNPALIRKSGHEIKNQCTKEGGKGENLASIPKSGLEIKNRCTLEGINRQNLASIRKSEPEIKNQCSRGVVAVCRRNHSPLPLRKLESDAENRCRKQHPPKSRHAQRSAATKTNTKNSIFVNPGLTLGRVPKMRSRKGI